MVTSEVARLVAAGLLLGLAGAAIAVFARAQPYGVSAADPIAYGTAILTVTIAMAHSPLGRTGDEIEVHLGCLDTPNHLRPTYESWVIRREDWLPPFDVVRRYPQDGKARAAPNLEVAPFDNGIGAITPCGSPS